MGCEDNSLRFFVPHPSSIFLTMGRSPSLHNGPGRHCPAACVGMYKPEPQLQPCRYGGFPRSPSFAVTCDPRPPSLTAVLASPFLPSPSPKSTSHRLCAAHLARTPSPPFSALVRLSRSASPFVTVFPPPSTGQGCTAVAPVKFRLALGF